MSKRQRRPFKWARYDLVGYYFPIDDGPLDKVPNKMPGGVWAMSERKLHRITQPGLQVLPAEHRPSGEPFVLMALRDGELVGCRPDSEAAIRLLDWDDPSGWVAAQEWRILPPQHDGPKPDAAPQQATESGSAA